MFTQKTFTLSALFFVLLSAITLVPSFSDAALIIETEIASGQLTKKLDNNVVELDNRQVFYPSRPDLSIDLSVGEPITLAYAKDHTGKNVYFKFAPGLNSLEKTKPTGSPKDRSQPSL